MKRPFRASINLALYLGLSLMVLIGLSSVTSYLTLNSLIRDAQQETRTQETVVLLARMVSGIKTAESLQRRYLLTGTAPDLAAYQQARAGVQQALRRGRAAQPATDGQQDWRTLEGAVARRIELLEQAVTARQQAGLEAATASAVSRTASCMSKSTLWSIESTALRPWHLNTRRPEPGRPLKLSSC